MQLEQVGQITTASEAGEAAARAERDGYAAWSSGEAGFDVFVASTLAVAATTTMAVGTAVAVALSRTPMTVAYATQDLMRLARGRFALGLGSQVRAHVERRFSMPWSAPAARMREFIVATRTILQAWEDGVAPSFDGDFYTHTLSSPFFAARPHGFGLPPIGLAAVGPRMTEVAGEVADVLLAHPFTTPAFLAETTLPALASGAARAGRPAAEVDVSVQAFVVTGRSEEEMAAVRRRTCRQLAFYASTPAYAPVLESIGREALQPELHELSRAGRWRDMTALVDDGMLAAMAVVTEDPDSVGGLLAERFAGLADRVSIYPTWQPDPAGLAALRSALDPVDRPPDTAPPDEDDR